MSEDIEKKTEEVRKEIKKSSAKKVPAKKVPAKKVPAKATAPAKKTSSDEDRVSLSDLASEAKVSSAKARRLLRAAEVEREEGRWSWRKGSNALKTARKAVGLAA